MSWKPDQPYNDLPPLPPDVELESKRVLKACVEASRALADLKGAGEKIPDQKVLINSIGKLEAQASSEIENIVTTTDKLFKAAALKEGQIDPQTKEARNYENALTKGVESLKDRHLSLRTSELVCSCIKAKDMQVRRVPNAIGSAQTGEVIYTPPDGAHLLEKLTNWEKFLNEDSDLDPLVRLAVGHYQFEAIHPFTDGNGRTGRILNILFLIKEKLLLQPILYHSGGIIARHDEYYKLLRDVTETGNWEDWIVFMLEVIEETSRRTRTKIDAIFALQKHTGEFLRANRPKAYDHHLVELVFMEPYCRISHVVDAGLGKRETASKKLKELVKAGILTEEKSGREKLFIHSKFLQLLQRPGNDFKPYRVATI